MLDNVEMLERLSAMWKAGTLTDEEFGAQKAELLSRWGRSSTSFEAANNLRSKQDLHAGFSFGSRLPRIAALVTAIGVAGAAVVWGFSGTAETSSSGGETQSIADVTDARAQSSDSGECSEYDGVSNNVARGQLGAYFMMYSPVESSTFAKLRENGGLRVTGFPRVSGTCNAAFRVQGVVDGTSYDVQLVCPILESASSDVPGKMLASSIDIKGCQS